MADGLAVVNGDVGKFVGVEINAGDCDEGNSFVARGLLGCKMIFNLNVARFAN